MLSGRRVRADFAGADLDAGFALLRLAENQCAPEALRAAENALADGRRRCAALKGGGGGEFRSRLNDLGEAIDRAKLRRVARPGAKILIMPRR